VQAVRQPCPSGTPRNTSSAATCRLSLLVMPAAVQGSGRVGLLRAGTLHGCSLPLEPCKQTAQPPPNHSGRPQAPGLSAKPPMQALPPCPYPYPERGGMAFRGGWRQGSTWRPCCRRAASSTGCPQRPADRGGKCVGQGGRGSKGRLEKLQAAGSGGRGGGEGHAVDDEGGKEIQ